MKVQDERNESSSGDGRKKASAERSERVNERDDHRETRAHERTPDGTGEKGAEANTRLRMTRHENGRR